MKLKVKELIKFHLKNFTKIFQLKPKVQERNIIVFVFPLIFLAFIPENIKREVLQEISRFLESNLP